MKKLALIPGLMVLLFALNSCCWDCVKGKRFGVAGCENEDVEVEETVWVEEEVYADHGPKGGKGGTVTVKRPVVRTVKKPVKCTACGSWYCPKPDCCDTVSTAVLRRATVQGGSGEPHLGQIPTMKVLAPEN